MSFNPVQNQNLKRAELKYITRTFVKNENTLCRQEIKCTYKTVFLIFEKKKKNAQRKSMKTHIFSQRVDFPKISL